MEIRENLIIHMYATCSELNVSHVLSSHHHILSHLPVDSSWDIISLHEYFSAAALTSTSLLCRVCEPKATSSMQHIMCHYRREIITREGGKKVKKVKKEPTMWRRMKKRIKVFNNARLRLWNNAAWNIIYSQVKESLLVPAWLRQHQNIHEKGFEWKWEEKRHTEQWEKEEICLSRVTSSGAEAEARDGLNENERWRRRKSASAPSRLLCHAMCHVVVFVGSDFEFRIFEVDTVLVWVGGEMMKTL